MPSKSNLLAVVAMALAAVCVFIAMKLADYAGGLELVNAWTKDLGVLGMVLFALLSGVSVVFFFPGSILMTASGAAFGLRDGFIVALRLVGATPNYDRREAGRVHRGARTT